MSDWPELIDQSVVQAYRNLFGTEIAEDLKAQVIANINTVSPVATPIAAAVKYETQDKERDNA